MSTFPSLPNRANLVDLFTAHSKGVGPLLALHDALLREDNSELTMGERELITAFVSSLNTCEYCFDAHKTLAIAFGVDPDHISALINDIGTADIDDRLKPLFIYAKKITLQDTVLPADVQAITDAGWSEDTLYTVLMITSLYNMMNRVVSGAGLSPKQSFEATSRKNEENEMPRTYTQWGKDAGFLSEI